MLGSRNDAFCRVKLISYDLRGAEGMPLAATPLFALTLLLLPARPVEAPRPPEKVLLRYVFQEGETARYRIGHDRSLLAVKGQTVQKTVHRSETEQHFKVVDVDPNGVATLRMEIDATRMEYAFDDERPRVFDSREGDLPPGVEKAIGRPLADLRLRPNGSVASIEPLVPAREREAIPGKLSLEGDADSLFAHLPEGPVSVGATWHDTVLTKVAVTERLSQEVKILRQYRLDRIEEGTAVIAMKTSVVTPVTEPGMLVQLIERTSSGTIRFHLASGRVVQRTINVDNSEFGWQGADSSLRAVSTWTEQLVAEPTAVSAR